MVCGRSVELPQKMTGAGEGNRTLVTWLGTKSSTIELHPPDFGIPRRETYTFRVTAIVPLPWGVGQIEGHRTTGHPPKGCPLAAAGDRSAPGAVRYRPPFSSSPSSCCSVKLVSSIPRVHRQAICFANRFCRSCPDYTSQRRVPCSIKVATGSESFHAVR